MEKSKTIFGNEIDLRTYRKACAKQKNFLRKFGNDLDTDYRLALKPNEVLGPVMSVQNIVTTNDPSAPAFSEVLPENPILIGNIRMGFGHYRISMAMASCAKAMGFTPLWLDLNSFPETTCTKIISYQNDLYSMGSRLSQKSKLFNKLVWEPMNYEGFKKLSYNAGDQKNAELMTPLFRNIPKNIPLIGTHVWPAQAAVHAGMESVVNAIPDNWPMALHLSEGAIHTVQTPNCYWGYRTLNGFDGNKVLNQMSENDIFMTGHYIDHEIVENIEKDCVNRIHRSVSGKPIRFLLTIGGAGAQGEFFAKIIEALVPYVKANKACIYINCGDYENVWEKLKKMVPALNENGFAKTHFNNWQEESDFAEKAILGEDAESGSGVHVFCNKDIFGAVYITNLLMRACDALITKPSELAFYPVPKIFIRRIGGHEMWGAIHSADLGDGTQECETPEAAVAAVKSFIEHPEIPVDMNESIMKNNRNGIYSGAYEAVKLATGGIK
ncbi:MAG: hypothetical protein KBS64_05190 [Treponema sp.]|nr:hypothetical protein [Candidatus Treponema equi]